MFRGVLQASHRVIFAAGARVVAVCVGAAISILALSRVENLGPQGLVQTEAGDIHRHDFVQGWGWPQPCAEHFTANWFVYRPSGVVGATSEQVATWSRERIAELECAGIVTHEQSQL